MGDARIPSDVNVKAWRCKIESSGWPKDYCENFDLVREWIEPAAIDGLEPIFARVTNRAYTGVIQFAVPVDYVHLVCPRVRSPVTGSRS